jgi:hypothetical protein
VPPRLPSPVGRPPQGTAAVEPGLQVADNRSATALSRQGGARLCRDVRRVFVHRYPVGRVPAEVVEGQAVGAELRLPGASPPRRGLADGTTSEI